jgi:hypothetical protein
MKTKIIRAGLECGNRINHHGIEIKREYCWVETLETMTTRKYWVVEAIPFSRDWTFQTKAKAQEFIERDILPKLDTVFTEFPTYEKYLYTAINGTVVRQTLEVAK